MPFARQPFKAVYVAQRMFTTLMMVPFWVLFYSIMPRRFRPRPSWSLKQIVAVNFTRRIYKVAELAGVTWATRDPEEACDNNTLRETRFEWIDPLPEDLRTGIIADRQVPLKRVGAFVWPKDCPEGMFVHAVRIWLSCIHMGLLGHCDHALNGLHPRKQIEAIELFRERFLDCLVPGSPA